MRCFVYKASMKQFTIKLTLCEAKNINRFYLVNILKDNAFQN